MEYVTFFEGKDSNKETGFGYVCCYGTDWKKGDVFSFESKENQKTCDAGVAWRREWRYALYLVSCADVPHRAVPGLSAAHVEWRSPR